jgi:cysteinyl-tRNA synthetase
LHNTLTRTKEVFQPIDPHRVRLYVCGPTVYQRIHVGNARAFVVFDVLFRLLHHLYGEGHVVYARNITDIDDKIINQARANGETIRAVTEQTATQFHEDLAALGCLPPTHEPRATEHVDDMIALIATLIERGHAYAAEGHVLFSVPSMPAYGRLSGRNRDEQIAGARVDVAPYKRDPADFVLWKPSTGDQPGWDSPWGHGRPGWHIECSAMSEHFLGPLPFDIHGGGLDLIFPHHENEIAQSCCAHGLDTMARFWLHNGFLDMQGEKMSKSLGNVIHIPDIIEHFGIKWMEALRLLLLSTHYCQPAVFSLEGVDEARRSLTRMYAALKRVPPDMDHVADSRLVEALADDLNTPQAISILHSLLGELNKTDSPKIAARLRASAAIMGLLQQEPAAQLQGEPPLAYGVQDRTGSATALPSLRNAEIELIVAEREVARRNRDFRKADELRDKLTHFGVILEDRPDGTTDWRRL